MYIEEQALLSRHTTLGVGGPARYLAAARSVSELGNIFNIARHEQLPVSILGGGSNVFAPDFGISGLVIKIQIPGVSVIPINKKISEVVVGAGVSWDSLVEYTVKKGLWGIENMSGIPGTVGAAPIQNIGAYGSELGDVCAWVEVFDMQTLKTYKLSSYECSFSYRDSIFKHEIGRAHV